MTAVVGPPILLDEAVQDLLFRQARYNAILQIGFLIVAIRAVGLAAGPILGFDHEAVDQAFFPDGRCQSVLVMNVGRGLPKRYDRLPRLPYEDAVQIV